MQDLQALIASQDSKFVMRQMSLISLCIEAVLCDTVYQMAARMHDACDCKKGNGFQLP